MSRRFERLWASAKASFWFVPVVMSAAAIGLSFATIEIDQAVDKGSVNGTLIYTGGPDGARTLLSTIAGSMITVAGVSFSITIAALALASTQFGPRLLRNFIRDTGNQLVLGTFISAFIYCLLVLRSVRSVPGDEFVPYISVSIGVLTAVAGLLVLIYFIHHVSNSIQATTVIAGVGRDLDNAIARLFPREVGRGVGEIEGGKEQVEEALKTPGAVEVFAPHSGYVQSVNLDSLMSLAREKDLVIGVSCHPGNFAARASQIARVWSRAGGGRWAAEARRRRLRNRRQAHLRTGRGVFDRSAGGDRPPRALTRHQRSVHGHRLHRPVGCRPAPPGRAGVPFALPLRPRGQPAPDRTAGAV